MTKREAERPRVKTNLMEFKKEGNPRGYQNDDFFVPVAKICLERLIKRFPEDGANLRKMKGQQIKAVYRSVMRRVCKGEAVGPIHQAERIGNELDIKYMGPQLGKCGTILYHIFLNTFASGFAVTPQELTKEGVKHLLDVSDSKFSGRPAYTK